MVYTYSKIDGVALVVIREKRNVFIRAAKLVNFNSRRGILHFRGYHIVSLVNFHAIESMQWEEIGEWCERLL